MRCAKCGQENPTGKIVCSRCGTRLRPAGAPVTVTHTPEQFMAWLRADLIKLAAVLAAVIIMAIALGTLAR